MPIRTHVSQRLTRTDKHYKYSISTELKKDEVKTVSHTRSAAHFTKPHLRQYIFQVVLVHLQKKRCFQFSFTGTSCLHTFQCTQKSHIPCTLVTWAAARLSVTRARVANELQRLSC